MLILFFPLQSLSLVFIVFLKLLLLNVLSLVEARVLGILSNSELVLVYFSQNQMQVNDVFKHPISGCCEQNKHLSFLHCSSPLLCQLTGWKDNLIPSLCQLKHGNSLLMTFSD